MDIHLLTLRPCSILTFGYVLRYSYYRRIISNDSFNTLPSRYITPQLLLIKHPHPPSSTSILKATDFRGSYSPSISTCIIYNKDTMHLDTATKRLYRVSKENKRETDRLEQSSSNGSNTNSNTSNLLVGTSNVRDGGGLDGAVVADWHNDLTGDSNSGGRGHGDGSWVTNIVTLGDGDNGWQWAVGGVASNSDTLGGGDVSVSTQSGGRQSRGSGDSRELHCRTSDYRVGYGIKKF